MFTQGVEQETNPLLTGLTEALEKKSGVEHARVTLDKWSEFYATRTVAAFLLCVTEGIPLGDVVRRARAIDAQEKQTLYFELNEEEREQMRKARLTPVFNLLEVEKHFSHCV